MLRSKGFLNVVGVITSAMQIGGVALAVTGLLTRPAPQATGTWSIVPMAAGADVGATFRWTEF